MKLFKVVFVALAIWALIFTGLGIAQQFTYGGRLGDCIAKVTVIYNGNQAHATKYCMKYTRP